MAKSYSDSRKRPSDGDNEGGSSKRSNQGGGDDMHLKVLVPAIAAGAIIGKGGETITQLQKDNNMSVKMSKANDFYPGTNERVCLMVGPLDAIKKVHKFVTETIYSKPEPFHPMAELNEAKVAVERHKQVKILIPNSTAGMIIGKGGNFIREIKDQSGAYVQISQKSKDENLPERCVTVAGEPEQTHQALDMILEKIAEDPQSSSCPNISYADYKGPVASANPTGSPFAAHDNMGGGGRPPHHQQKPHHFNNGPVPHQMPGPGVGMTNLGSGMTNLHLTSPAMEQLRIALRGSGYTEQALEEIAGAVITLANYGFLGLGPMLGLGALGGNTGTLTLASLANILQQGGVMAAQQQTRGGFLGSNGTAAQDNPSLFGPVGSSQQVALMELMDGNGDGGREMMIGGGGDFHDMGYQGRNENSFGLGTDMGAGFRGGRGDSPDDTKRELEVGEHIVGVILGPAGRGIVELQRQTGATVQISKKGIYAPGTRNRIVTISGSMRCVRQAELAVQRRIQEEESKRTHSARDADRPQLGAGGRR